MPLSKIKQLAMDAGRVSIDPPPGGLVGETVSEAPATACVLAESDIAHLHPVRDAMDLDPPLPAADGTQNRDLPINEGGALNQANADRTAGLMDERTKHEAEILFKAFLEVENSVGTSSRVVSPLARPAPGPTVADPQLVATVREGSKSGTKHTFREVLQASTRPPRYPGTRALSRQLQSTKTSRTGDS
ncbi:hypothetical protein C7212DRAFT_365486 [Tuber magnatum]|uniref:Uncharacterized protein n=1 Tax=Tuber magnatum TaxID=42249 RepID=A0A317SK32_9PEZI|nr:hypothetical protein C7212DRAFT_365486 [Tuber magnatum]